MITKPVVERSCFQNIRVSSEENKQKNRYNCVGIMEERLLIEKFRSLIQTGKQYNLNNNFLEDCATSLIIIESRN